MCVCECVCVYVCECVCVCVYVYVCIKVSQVSQTEQLVSQFFSFPAAPLRVSPGGIWDTYLFQ